ncbi:hypothetical protein [Methylobacterium haplocladii]|uniref:Uncharacterized protein n=1 Tax=Methylobacterium haplocladii TaxID=1176176 RepID=A0A512ISI6_9HYPH|nr:hypothetical protein [Methylobacterium haplocladii]GEP00653.1 hypothetical protein MHA02_30400 [Methylobacterium haplocladii]GJD85416.1 hypothetical protein HPGCJGGD_3305 [Methylobacterium haplocladii]GLS57801.1 hypothetical protein GCM10007887_04570 [Methylobacterium haplocladii]
MPRRNPNRSAAATQADVEPVVVPEGFAAVEHDDPNASVTVDGVTYAANDEGWTFAPIGVLVAIAPHGFRLVDLGETAPTDEPPAA